LNYTAKLFGLACVLYRTFITSVITWVGCQFLMWTSTNIELILNALALTFILELDRITYKAAITASRQNLISRLRRLTWYDPTGISRKYMNFSKLSMMFSVLGASSLVTFGLRQIQYYAYMDMFTLAASICLFQGPTPGYWTQFRDTFPAPGLCETVLGLKCEAPIVGEAGVPCVENWNQKLCKFYVQTDSLFSTWSSIDWQNQGACVAHINGRPYPVRDLMFGQEGPTLQLLSQACQKMWQREPQIEFRNKARDSTGPRLRVYPYQEFVPSGPFWCKYFEGSEKVILPGRPLEITQWAEQLEACVPSTLAYSGGRGDGMLRGAGIGEMDDAAGADNLTSSDGPFSGVWLNPKMGVVIIENKGSSAVVTNSLLPWSPVPAKVTKKTLKFLKEPYYSCKLKDDGKIYMSNGEVLVNQKTEADKMNQKKDNRNGPRFVWWR